jgi:EAL domain-containing protein (putative c-di-GMP-specific phosphodiesterase class I)
VNLSARQVAAPDIVDVVGAVLSETGLDPALLDLEITETVLMEDPEASAQTLEALKALGVRIVLDDFGTGFSSLAYVRRFPIDVLKVDRSFVQDLGDGATDATIVEAVLSMARGLRVGVIAEGVETPAQSRALEALGCELAQGYLFARPLDPADLEQRLRAQPRSLASGARA